MKKSLLSFVALCFANIGFAQVLPYEYTNLQYKTQYESIVISKSANDSANKLYVVQNTIGKSSMYHSVDLYAPQWAISNTTTGYNCTPGETLKVSFTNKNIESNWGGGIYTTWAGWGKKMLRKPNGNPFVRNSTDTLIGTFVDLKANPIITIIIKASSKTDVTLWISDKNGRTDELGTPTHWTKGNEWDTLVFRYEKMAADGISRYVPSYSPSEWDDHDAGFTGDCFSNQWWGVDHSLHHSDSYIKTATLLDLHNIIGIGISFDIGNTAKRFSLEKQKTIEIKSIEFGDKNRYNLAPINESKQDSINSYYVVNNISGAKRQGIELVDTKADIRWITESANYAINNQSDNKQVNFSVDSTKNNTQSFTVMCAGWGSKRAQYPPLKHPFTYELDSVAWKNDKSVHFNMLENQDTLIGSFINIKKNPQITLVAKASDSTNARIQLIDKNGRISNLISAAHWIGKADFDTLLFSYNQKKLDGTPDWYCNFGTEIDNNAGIAANGYGDSWWNVKNGRSLADLPILFGKAAKEGAVLLDLENIVGVNVIFDAENASKQYALKTNKTITISSLKIGEVIVTKPSSIAGDSAVCKGAQYSYWWPKVADATFYTLKYTGTGATILVSDNSATVTFAANATVGKLQLTANTRTSSSAIVEKQLNFIEPPVKPVISGNAMFCQSSSSGYTVYTDSKNMINWSVGSNLFLLGSTTNQTISVQSTDTMKTYVMVEVSNSCGKESIKKDIQAKAAPSLIGVINGLNSVCANTSAKYFVTPVKYATSYTWKTNNETFTGESTHDIKIGIADETIGVFATNECGTSDLIKKNITIKKAYTEPIGLVTVDEGKNGISVVWEHTKNQGTDKYRVYRETDVRNVWSPVSNYISYSSLGTFQDTNVVVNQKQYSYKLFTFNECGDSSGSVSHRNLLLQSSYSVESDKVNLNWSPYEGLDVETYDLYRVYPDGHKEAVMQINGKLTMAFDEKPVANTYYRLGFSLQTPINPASYHFKSDNNSYGLCLSNAVISKKMNGLDDNDNSISLWPNPAKDYITIISSKQIYQIQLINIYGEMVYFIEGNQNTIHLNIENLSTGIYGVILNQGGELKSYKLIKE